MKVWRYPSRCGRELYLLFIATVVFVFLGRPTQCAAAGPVTTDLWDVSGGATVIADSGALFDFPVTNIFGATDGVGQPYAIYRDDQLAGFVHFVEWQTVQPIQLTSFNLYANHDGPLPSDANERGFSRFTLRARNPVTLQFDPVFTYIPTNPYTYIGSDFLLISTAVTPITAQVFRAEFEQYGDRSPSSRGPRIVELDGFGTVVPEPQSSVLLGLGIFGGLMSVENRTRRRTRSD